LVRSTNFISVLHGEKIREVRRGNRERAKGRE
jgi:hypothetical protein